jgi:hypothetical protein
MKNQYLSRLKFILLFLVGILPSVTLAQLPDGFSYQAVIRDAQGMVMSNRSIGIQFSILQGSATGTNVYTEHHTVTTNANGLITLTIGGGTVVSGLFADIEWEKGSFYLGVAVDLANVGKYTALGVSPLLSVPYAMYAQKAGNASGGGISVGSPQKGDILYYDGSQWQLLAHGAQGDVLTVKDNIPTWGAISNNNSGSSHYIGELYGGGIIFHLWEMNGVQHGLIASLADLPSTAPDDDNDGVADGFIIMPNIGTVSAPLYDQIPNANSQWNGKLNTTNIVTYQNNKGYTGTAAQTCRIYNAGGNTDWYLPSVHEISLLYHSLFVVNQVLENDGKAETKIIIGNYWASSIFNTTQGWVWGMARGYCANQAFDTYRYVRAIRQF